MSRSSNSKAYEVGPPPPPRGVEVSISSSSAITRESRKLLNSASATSEIRGRVARITGRAESSKELILNFKIDRRTERALILTQTLNVRPRDTFRFRSDEQRSREVSFFKIAASPAAEVGESYPVRFYLIDRFGDESNKVLIRVEVKRKSGPSPLPLLLIGAALVGIVIAVSKRREREHQERPEDHSAHD